jgi:hypothetical protein
VKARLWKLDVKVASSKLRLGYLACRALYRRRQLNIRFGVGAFGVVEIWWGGVSGGEVVQGGAGAERYLYWTRN